MIQAVPDADAKTLYIVTAFVGQKRGTSQLIDANAPMFTSKSGSVVVPKNSISQKNENVKTFPENSKKFSIRDIDNDRYILREAFSDKDFISRYYDKRQELQKYKDALESYNKALEKINEIQEQGGEILQGKRRQIRRTTKALEGGV